MEYNRNLSDVIDSIQDDGPSLTVAGASPVGNDPPDSALAPGAGRRRPVLRIAFLFLLAALLAAAVFLFVSGRSGGYFPPVLSNFSIPAADSGLAVQFRELQKTQSLLVDRIDQLEASVAQNNATLAQYLARQAAEKEHRPDTRVTAVVSPALAADEGDLSPSGHSGAEERGVPGFAPAPPEAAVEAVIAEAAPAAGAQSAPSDAVARQIEDRDAVAEADEAPVPVVSETLTGAAAPASVPQPAPVQQAGAETTAQDDLPSTPSPAAEADGVADGETDAVAGPTDEADAAMAVSAAAPGEDPGEKGWVINVGFSEKQQTIIELMERLWQAGIVTEQQKVSVNGRNGYRLRIPGFSSSAEASDYLKNKLDTSLGIRKPWVSRR